MNQSSNRYLPFALVAALAGTLGWGVSTVVSTQTKAQTSSITNESLLPPSTMIAANQMPPTAPLAVNGQSLQWMVIPAAGQALMPVNQGVLTLVPAQAVPVNAPVSASAPLGRGSATPVARARDNQPVTAPAAPVTRKAGLSNKAKTAIVIGGGAGLGAVIGGIAKGKKGAAIGALAGGGAAAVYSVIRQKKHQPIF